MLLEKHLLLPIINIYTTSPDTCHFVNLFSMHSNYQYNNHNSLSKMKQSITCLVTGFLCLFLMSVQAQTISGPGTACQGQSASYSFSEIVQGLNYTWSVTGGSLQSASAGNASVTWYGVSSGQITITATNPSGTVISSVTKNVVIIPEPAPVLTTDIEVGCNIPSIPEPDPDTPPIPPATDSSGCYKVCENSTSEFTASGNPGSTYAWTVTGGSVASASGNTVTINWGAAGFGKVTARELTTSGCFGFSTRCIQIMEGPTASFTVLPHDTAPSNMQACQFREIQFIDLSAQNGSSPIVSWQWDFGDGSYSALPSPTHTYKSAGTFTVKLTVTNACHCSSEYTINVNVKSAEVLEITCPSVVCEDDEATYSIKTGCGKYDWELSGGTITSDSTSVDYINVVWDKVDSSGFGYVTAYDNYCGSDCATPLTVQVPVIQQKGYIQGPNAICRDERVLFKLPRWPGTHFSWSITGDADVYPSDQPNEAVVYGTGAGSATLRCSYENKITGCGGRAYIDLQILPTVTIIGRTEFCLGEGETFSLSNGATAHWSVVRPNGYVFSTTGQYLHQAHFNQNGTWIVTATGSDFCLKEPLEFNVERKPFTPQTLDVPDSVCPGIPIEIFVGTDDPISVFNWKISNGTFSGGHTAASGNKVVATFSGSGPYTLKVWRKLKSDLGCTSDTLVKVIYPKIIDPDISGPVNVCENTYQDYMAGFKEGDFYEWSVVPQTAGSIVSGQGTTDVNVLWNSLVTATPELVVKVRSCGNEHFDTLAVDVTQATTVSITAVNTICRGHQVSFSVSGAPSLAGSYDAIEWDFGDGNTFTSTGSTAATHTYTDLISSDVSYTVSVSVHNPNGCVTVARASHNITVQPAPVAYISPKRASFCSSAGLSQTLTATVQSGIGNTVTYAWYKTNGNTNPLGSNASYTATSFGQYYCVLTGSNGCTTKAFASIDSICGGSGPSMESCDLVPTRADITYDVTGCGEITATLSYPNKPGYTWDYSVWTSWQQNFSSPPDKQNAIFQFDTAGLYHISANVMMIDGNGDTCFIQADTAVIVPYQAGIRYEVNSCNGSGQYNLTVHDHSNYYPSTPIGSYSFYIPGEGTWNTSSFTTALSPGSYPVRLTINGSGYPNCVVWDTIELPEFPVADFSFDFNGACEDFPIQFNNLSSPSGDLEYLWIFDDGAKTTVSDPSRTYNLGGDYEVKLIATNRFGCQDSITKTVNVSANGLQGVLSSSSIIACEGSLISLTYDKGLLSADPDRYIWQPDSFAIVNHPDNSIEVWESGSYFVTVLDTVTKCYFNPLQSLNVEFVPIPKAVINAPAMCAFRKILTWTALPGMAALPMNGPWGAV
ncbi:MAG: hypothetical protein CMI35_18180 [Owenweeksia sp.]|nr:hypothetical protein [Owenweeksia sp.]